ncbi:hypothetical protein PsAD13_05006 [Pseudovibrio sp. Ad13]|nr:hypothetical protein PsAD46_05447 [Pseudovibrio sp. Ad46]KZK79660.1 hypothetical protein PsAD13_05006 [Pseudovibrio sp. Ad13]KZK98108.1 hypothetical protein PsAD5_01749 [Pseudovibrio sp. Ad5]
MKILIGKTLFFGGFAGACVSRLSDVEALP